MHYYNKGFPAHRALFVFKRTITRTAREKEENGVGLSPARENGFSRAGVLREPHGIIPVIPCGRLKRTARKNLFSHAGFLSGPHRKIPFLFSLSPISNFTICLFLFSFLFSLPFTLLDLLPISLFTLLPTPLCPLSLSLPLSSPPLPTDRAPLPPTAREAAAGGGAAVRLRERTSGDGRDDDEAAPTRIRERRAWAAAAGATTRRHRRRSGSGELWRRRRVARGGGSDDDDEVAPRACTAGGTTTMCESGSGKLGWRRHVARGGGGQVRRRAFLGLGLGFLYFFDFFGFFVSVQVILFNRSMHGIIDYPMRST